MSMKNVSLTFLNLFLPHINKIKSSKNINTILKKIYTNIKLSKEYHAVMFKNVEMKKIEIDEGNKEEILDSLSLIGSDSFVPENIKHTIKRDIACIETYEITIKNIHFTIEFLICKREKNEKNMKRIIVLLHFLLSFYKTNKVESVKISLFFSDEKKKVPVVEKQTMDLEHINTAVTYSCKLKGEVFLYRKEEWFKVLIHELMHSLCFDFAKLHMDFSIKNKLKNMFSVNSEFHITETYSEFWANIFNTSIISFMALSNKDDIEEFYLNFKILNIFEKYYSIFSCIKVLDHMGLSYKDIITDENKTKSISLYKENTNVFAYHILKSVWLFNTEEFLLWFNKHNHNLIFSKKDEEYIADLLEKTHLYYKSDEYLDKLKLIEDLFFTIKKDNDYKKLIKTLRMTIVELN